MVNIKQSKQSERAERLAKLTELKKLGINPYPSKFDRSHNIAEVKADFERLAAAGEKTAITGRLRNIRAHGNLSFAVLEDMSGAIQVVLSKKDLGPEPYRVFSRLIDNGDFAAVKGYCFRTKTGEPSVMAQDLTLLAKALRPLPDKWSGLKDEEERLRRRYLDLLANPELKDLFAKKAVFWQSIRDFLLAKGFLEVETPALETSAGGADARPFVTRHNALDLDVYLRISMGELWQKRLMVAGLEKTFEIGRQFRNEGMDAEHLQDYTQMEFYWAYADYNAGMKLVEEMVKEIALKTFNTLKFDIRGFSVDLGGKWERYDYAAVVKENTGVDIFSAGPGEIVKNLERLKIEYDKKGFNLTRGLDNLWKYCRKLIAGPGFLTGIPAALSPLAKNDPDHPGTVERFQVILAGSEVGNGYSELNDPLDQAARFTEQQKLREAGDAEAQMYDHDFVEALEYGMPPTCGFGLSERLFSFLAGKNARECQFFPLMRPK